MEHPQISRVARRARQQEKLRAATGRPPQDSQLRRMLTSHVQCGEEMQLVTDLAMPGEPVTERNDGGMATYRCACGFSFDQRQD
ncbi:hypothetical protein [Pseudarthrobacter sp. NamE5]|uniref:hypothetical protein n=1 Tax=Pseudarthrobacter sp. NamE5 TaxID=2576839 RepID=UPI00110ABD6E|nr:hypothetical protein [Pseudarthrobacter sp. NamE5]TLM84709.1 hypothetical protein FDW84_11380 [Pseudarthrobacter sp. NamE5]